MTETASSAAAALPPDHSRLKYVDYAKALTIFLVIVGHTNDPYIPGKSWFYLDFCYAFHMPLFFMLSGFFLRARNNPGEVKLSDCLRKDFFALIIPYFIWGCIYMQFSYRKWFQLAYGSWLNLRTIGTLTSLWFLPVLFLSKNYCNAIFIAGGKWKLRPELLGWIALPLLFVIGFALPHNNALDGNHIGNFWGFDIAFVAAGFVMAGAMLRPFFDRLAKGTLWTSLALSAVMTAVFWVSFNMERPLLTAGVDNTMAMCNAEYGLIGYCLVNAFSGSFALISFCIVLEKLCPGNRTLLFIGANTMGIYLIHKHIIYALKGLFQYYGTPPIADLRMALVVAVPALLFAMLIMLFVMRYVPHLLGKRVPPEKRQSIREMFNMAFSVEDSAKL